MNYPIIYDKFETDFTTFGLAVLEHAKNVKIQEVINGNYLLTLILPRIDPKWQHVQGENFIKVDGQLFRIRNFDEQRDAVGKLLSNIQCEHVWYDANDCEYFPEFSMIGVTPRKILEAVFAGTRFTVGTVDAELANTDIEMSKTNPAAIVNKLIENVGGELERDNYTIGLRTAIGNNNGVQFRVGKNTVEIKITRDTKNLCTRLYPYGTDDLDISSVNGGLAYIDSSYINNYDYIHKRFVDYREIENPSELLTKGQAEFSTVEKDGIDKPKVTIEMTVLELKKLSGRPFETFVCGDTIRVIDEDLSIDYNARIMEYEYYPYEPQRSAVVLANFRDNIGKIFANLADTRNQVQAMTTPAGKVRAAWFESIMSTLQSEVSEGLIKKMDVYDHGLMSVDNIENPTKAMAIVNGMFAIADNKKENGDWDWRTFGTGSGFVADLIVAGVLRLAEGLSVENDDGTTKLTTEGFEVTNPEISRAIIKSNQIALQAWTGSGWVNGLYFDTVTKQFVFDGTLTAEVINAIKAQIDVVISNTTITQVLSAETGYIAQLTVDRLLTEDKAQRYLNSDTSDINYQKIQEQYHQWITASTDGLSEEQATDRNGALLYWTDNTHTGTTLSETDYPVMTYVYTENVKLEISFEVGENNEPIITLGMGDGVTASSAKAVIRKGTTGLELNYYKSNTGDVRQILLNDIGIVQVGNTGASGLRNIAVGTAAPPSPQNNDLWIDTSGGV